MSSSDALRLTRDQIVRIIAALQAAGSPASDSIPLYRAALKGMRLVRIVERDQRFPTDLVKGPQPTLLTIGDDDFRDTGPVRWTCASQAMRWAASIMIYAGAGRSEIYQHAVDAALITGKLLLVETTPEHVLSWYALVRSDTPTLVVSPAFAPGPDRRSLSESVH